MKYSINVFGYQNPSFLTKYLNKNLIKLKPTKIVNQVNKIKKWF